jgi:CBS domain-containing protein
MRREVVTIDEDTTLCEVARIMLTQKVRRIPILDKEHKVIGMVSRGDVVKAFSKEYGL